jgi:hypothetical protein
MSIIGQCFGVAPGVLETVLDAPTTVDQLLDQLYRSAENEFRTGHEWHGLDRLVSNLDPPAYYAALGDATIGSIDVRGYGPARYLTAEDVADVAATLSEWTPDDMRTFFSLESFRAANIYTFHDRGESEEAAWTRLARAYTSLVRFYQHAAEDGEAAVFYLH